MIVEWIWGVLAGVFGWLLSLFPTTTLPAWVFTVHTFTVDAVSYINGWHMWVPLDAVRVGFLFLMSCSALVLLVRGFRIALSLFTGGGGSAA